MDEGDDEGQAVESGGLLYPGARVLKTGRTTGTTDGVVIPTELIAWKGGLASYEITIMGIGERKVFASKGDSGSLVMVKEGTMLKAAGLLHGINSLNDLALATPLEIIIEEGGLKWMAD